MPIAKKKSVKTKSKTKTKIKPKAKIKAKAKSKTQVKAKTKLKVKSKAKPKTKAKSKSKSKSKTKVKVKAKTKPKAKAKLKVKTRAKPKAKPKAKTKAKPKAKTKLKTKAKVATKAKKKLKSTSKAKTKPSTQFSSIQKNSLLEMINKIINLHKADEYGLKRLDEIDRILSQYNQHYTNPIEKFDAIVEYGRSKDPALIPKTVFVSSAAQNEDEVALFEILEKISHGKVTFAAAKEEISSIYANSLENVTGRKKY